MIIQCPHCCTELELPDESVGWKVQCVYCNEKFIATEEFVRKQKDAFKKKTIRLAPVKRKGELHTIIIKRPSSPSPKASTATRSSAPRKEITMTLKETDKTEGRAKARDEREAMVDKALAICKENGWTAEEFRDLLKANHIRFFRYSNGKIDLVVMPKAHMIMLDRRIEKQRELERKKKELSMAAVKRETTGRMQQVRCSDGSIMEIPAPEPWMYVAAILFPIWVPLWLIWEMIKALNPFSNPLMEPTDDDDAWSYAERERWQWTLGTGRYANKD